MGVCVRVRAGYGCGCARAHRGVRVLRVALWCLVFGVWCLVFVGGMCFSAFENAEAAEVLQSDLQPLQHLSGGGVAWV